MIAPAELNMALSGQIMIPYLRVMRVAISLLSSTMWSQNKSRNHMARIISSDHLYNDGKQYFIDRMNGSSNYVAPFDFFSYL